MRVIVADDSAVIREGVVRILTSAGLDVVAEARDADELLALVAAHHPDLVVVDIRMPPGGNAGLVAAERLRDEHGGSLGVLILSQYLEPDYALRLLRKGTRGVGYLLKDRVAEVSELADAARRVGSGGSAIDPAVVEELVRSGHHEDRLSSLTDREREVLGLIAQGRSNRSIADALDLALKTVESVIATIFSKLGLEPSQDDNRRVLAVLAFLERRV